VLHLSLYRRERITRKYVYAPMQHPIDAFTGTLIHIIDNQLILCRIFHLARLFLLPILRLRLDFAICISNQRSKIFNVKYFYIFTIYAIINSSKSKMEN
jgi:hypothetical protein